MAEQLRQYVRSGLLDLATVVDKIFEVAELHGLIGEPGSDKEAAVTQIAMSAELLPEVLPTALSDSRLIAAPWLTCHRSKPKRL
jgi:hypothetical protein